MNRQRTGRRALKELADQTKGTIKQAIGEIAGDARLYEEGKDDRIGSEKKRDTMDKPAR